MDGVLSPSGGHDKNPKKMFGKDFTNLTSSKYNARLDFVPHENHNIMMMLFDAFHELPYYYRIRYNTFAKSRVFAPCQDMDIISTSLKMPEIHKKNKLNIEKFELKNFASELCKKLSISPYICWEPKGIFKIEPYDFSELGEYYLDKSIIKSFGINAKFLDKGKWENDKNKAWSNLLLTIFSMWFKKHIR